MSEFSDFFGRPSRPKVRLGFRLTDPGLQGYDDRRAAA